MNKKEKELLKKQLEKEKEIISELKKVYQQAEKDIQDKIDHLLADDLTQSKIYQAEYQQALRGQINAILDNMDANNYDNIMDYLKGCYEDGYVGTMYNLAGQGIPLIMPIDQDAVVKAIQLDSKISEGLYKKLGINTQELKKSISSEVARGISGGRSYKDMARNLNNQMKIGLNKSIRIARTEGHRVKQEATMDGMRRSKDEGADIVKQWDSTLDGKTRPSHQRVDGEIREMDEAFSNGLQFPGDPSGPAKEVVNCRCVLLQRAKWALDEDELETLKKRAEFFGLDKTKDFDDFKKKYLEVPNLSPEDLKQIGILNFEISNADTWMANFQKDMDSLDTTKQYKFLWDKPVTIRDYEAKKGSIYSKKKKFKADMEKFDQNTEVGKSWYDTYQKRYNELLEFEEKGKKYSFYKKKIAGYEKEKEDALAKIAEIMNGTKPPQPTVVAPKPTPVVPKVAAKAKEIITTTKVKATATTAKVKETAKETVAKFKKQFKDEIKADKYFRSWADKTTYAMGDELGQKALYEYTAGSDSFNRPLSGYDYDWSRSSFKGVGNVDWNNESNFGKKNIDALTNLIEKTEPLKEGVVLSRGTDHGGLAGLFEGAGFDYDEIMNAIDDGSIKNFKGTVVKNNAFTSCGVSSNTGFGGNVTYTINAPAGTKMVYAEPQSYYGQTVSVRNNLYKPGMTKKGVGNEAEMLVQRGTYYRIDSIDVDGEFIDIKMTIVDQDSH